MHLLSDCAVVKYIIHQMHISAQQNVTNETDSTKQPRSGIIMDNRTWFKHVVVLTLGLLIFYVVSYVVIYETIMSPATKAAIIAAGESPSAEIGASVEALFPFPLILWGIGVLLSKWISF